MKSPMLLWMVLADEIGKELGVDTTRDIETVARRCRDEGEVSFLDITLPKLGKALDRALELGFWDSSLQTDFGLHEGLPRFLGGFLELIFIRETGVLLQSPQIDAIRAVRQLSGLYGKVFEVCDDRKVAAAMRSWIEVEDEVGEWSDSTDQTLFDEFEHAALAIWSHAFSRIDRTIDTIGLKPRHSSGSNADRRKGNERWMFTSWTDRLESIFPFVDYALPSHRYWELSQAVDFIDPGHELPSKVIAVPKTAEKPRIISMEPSYMQYMQQAISREFMRIFESSSNCYSDSIQLRRREHNQEAAREASYTGAMATIDLSEASDRLSNRLVMSMFRKFPSLYEGVGACRSLRADVGGLGVINLSKFAPMGSALTFPIQTVVFTTIVFMGIAKAKHISVGAAWQRYRRKVRVFGDDIVAPTDTVVSVMELLETYGLKVNHAKSFWNGKFRESCGGDYYDGIDVTYVKVRSRFPDTLQDAERIEAAVSLRNRFYFSGYWKTAASMDDDLHNLLKFYPTVAATSPLLGRHSFLDPIGERVDTRLQRPISKGYQARRALPKSPLDGTDALLKWFIEEHDDMPVSADERFERSGRSQHVTLKLRWGSVV